MTKTARTLIALGTLAIALAYLLLPKMVDAAPYPPAYKESSVTHVEHTSPSIETHPGNCVRADFTTVADASGFLAGPGDATWTAGADAAVFPPQLPKSGVSYICTARNNSACWRQGTVPTDCTYTSFLAADSPSAPFSFVPEPDGGQPMVFGVAASGTTNVSCCPIMPRIMSGN